MDLDRFKTNQELTEEGKWVDLDEVTRVKVARNGNRVYTKTLKRLLEPYSVQLKRGTMPEDKAEELICKAMAEGILVDWEGMTRGGKKLTYSKDAAFEILRDPRLKDFRELIASLSEDMELFREEELEAMEEK